MIELPDEDDDARDERSALRLAIGPNRWAMYAAAAIVALAVGAVAARAMADTVRGLDYVGPLSWALANLLASQTAAIVVGGVATGLTFGRAQPAFDPKYLGWLRTTPWRPGRVAPPRGRPTLISPLGLLPLAALALVAALRLPSGPPLAFGAALGFVVVAAVASCVTLAFWPALAIVALLAPLIPCAALDAPSSATAALLASAVVLAEWTHRATLARAWRADRVFDVRQIELQPRSKLGWLEKLPVKPRPRRRGLAFAGVALACWIFACLGIAGGGEDGRAFAGLQIYIGAFVGFWAMAFPIVGAPRSCDLFARLQTGRWLMPRMDRLLVAPSAIAGWVIVVASAPWPAYSRWNPAIAAACAFVTFALALTLTPSRLRWQTTGGSRIDPRPGNAQKQLEANLRRASGGTS